MTPGMDRSLMITGSSSRFALTCLKPGFKIAAQEALMAGTVHPEPIVAERSSMS